MMKEIKLQKSGLCPNCTCRRKVRKDNLSLYKSRKQKKQRFTKCGCGMTNNPPKKNLSVPDQELDSAKCNVYLRTKGWHHKLCCGQNKKF